MLDVTVRVDHEHIHSGEYKIKNEATTNKELKNDKLTASKRNI
jgi:hypothetical protein